MGLLTPKNTEDLARKVTALISNHALLFKSPLDLSQFNKTINDLLKEKKEKWIKEQFNSLSMSELVDLIDLLKDHDKEIETD
jgi:uncharacterized membrane protein YheB (UPF0754 family)